MLSFLFEGTGFLGLLIGGLGVANTLQFLFTRRRKELATLRSLGYRPREVATLIAAELIILGIVGSLLGVGAGWLLARFLVNALTPTLSFLITLRFDPVLAALAVVTGTLATCLFGLMAAARSIDADPAQLLRDAAPERGGGKPDRRLVLVSGGALALFSLLASWIVDSLVVGFGLVAGGLLALFAASWCQRLLLGLTVRVPVARWPLLSMARRNLGHRPARAAMCMVALAAGTFSIGFASTAFDNARARVAAREGSLEGLNLAVYGDTGDAETVSTLAAVEGWEARQRPASQGAVTRAATGEPVPGLERLEGRLAEDATWLIAVEGDAPWQAAPGTALAPASLSKGEAGPGAPAVSLGEALHVRGPAGMLAVSVAGFYRAEPASGPHGPVRGLVLSAEDLRGLGGEALAVSTMLTVAPHDLDRVTERLSAAVPDALVVSRRDQSAFINMAYRSLFRFVVGVSALALLAGCVLVANAVGLALIERRREIGVLKAIGYARRHLMATILLEYGLLGLVAGISGLIATRLTVIWVNARFALARLTMGPADSASLLAMAVALAISIAAALAWAPVRAMPLDVLRGRG